VFLQTQVIELGEWQVTKMFMRLMSIRSVSAKAKRTSASVPVAATGSGTPQCAVIGWPGQYGRFPRGIVADSENKIELWRVRLRELQPAFRTSIAYVVVKLALNYHSPRQ
jgi:hypothetical protein